jgi:hypothetical protein
MSRFDPHMMQQFSPRAVDADGNCFYRSISLGLFGSQSYHKYLRVLTTLELIQHSKYYDVSSPDFVMTDLPVLTPRFRNVLHNATVNSQRAELVHMVALSAALSIAVQAYCTPGTHGMDGMHPYTVHIRERHVCKRFDGDAVIVMWTYMKMQSHLMADPGHLVLLVPRRRSTSLHQWPTHVPTQHDQLPSESSADGERHSERTWMVVVVVIDRRRRRRNDRHRQLDRRR